MLHNRPSGSWGRLKFFALAISILLFLLAPLFTELGRDHLAIYKQALNIYLHHTLPVEGPEIIYTGTTLPGSLQSILVGIPLFLSHGMPWAAAVLIGLMNFLAALIILRLYRKLFPNFWEKYPFIFFSLFMFNPWLIRFTDLWNPSYLPFFSALFLYGVFLTFDTTKKFLGGVLIGFSILSAFQLHLSFPVLVVLLVYAMTKTRFSLGGIVTGTVLGSLTLIPKILAIVHATPKVEDGNFIFKNVAFSLGALADFPKIILRFLSFGTGEVSRFFGGSRGFGGAVHYTLKDPLLFFVFVVTVLFSAVLILIALRFYADRNRYIRLLKREKSFAAFVSESSLLIPFVLTFMFLFSIKGPSAHTFWIAVPWAFYPILSGLQTLLPKLGLRANQIWTVYVVFSLVCAGWTFKKVWKGSIFHTQQVFASQYPDLSPELMNSKRKGVYETYINVKDRTDPN